MNRMLLFLLFGFAVCAQAQDEGYLVPYTSKAGWSATFHLGFEANGVDKSHLQFAVLKGRGADGNLIHTHNAVSYVHIDPDNQYTETVAYTDHLEPVTASQVSAALETAIAGFAHPPEKGAIYKVRVISRHSIKAQGNPGLAATANDDYASNAYFEVIAVGNRLYVLTVVTDATEDPDEATHAHKVEAERFFSSFRLVTSRP